MRTFKLVRLKYHSLAGSYDVVTHTEINFLQMFLWERLGPWCANLSSILPLWTRELGGGGGENMYKAHAVVDKH